MPRLEVLIGMIASGKSTYARRRADEGAIIVSHDDLTQMLHAKYRYEPELRNAYRVAEEDLAFTFMNLGRDVVIDRTHLTRESRLRWTAFGKKMTDLRACRPVRLVAVCFPVEQAEVHARRRFAADARGRSIDEWLKVAEHHREQVELLDSQAEGWDEVINMPLAVPLGTPISELSGRPGHAGYEKFRDIAASWGHD